MTPLFKVSVCFGNLRNVNLTIFTRKMHLTAFHAKNNVEILHAPVEIFVRNSGLEKTF